MQGDFLKECLSLLKGKLHTAVQTCGFCSAELFRDVLSLANYFLYDLKIMDNKQHIKYTKVSNKKILHNFKLLVESGTAFVTRIPLIPEITDTKENITQIADFLRQNNVTYAELMSYNKMAGGKYAMTGREYKPAFNENIEVNPHEEIFQNNGIAIKILK